jgi:lauroyl/myristoyl acyltransferase
VTTPVEHLKDQRILDLILDLRRSHGIHFLPLGASSTIRTIVQKLRGNKVVLITADRAIEGQSIEALFFGRPARLPIGPVTLAQRTGAALVAAFCWRMPDGVISGQCVPLSLELTEEQRVNTDCMMRAMIEKMEHFIREHPEQWLAFTPIWMEDIKSHS